MKKRSIQKLKFKKDSISNLNTSTLKGGTIGTTTLSVNFCETIHFTKCFGHNYCGLDDGTFVNCPN